MPDRSETDLEEVEETDPHANCPKSPIFGRDDSTKALYNAGIAPKSPVFGRVDSTKALDNTGIAQQSPVFGRVASTQALDYETQIPFADVSQTLLAAGEPSPAQGSLKISKLSRSKRRKALMGNEPGEEEEMLRHGGCRTRPVFGKSSQEVGETSPVFSEESPVFREASPVFGMTNPVSDRAGSAIGRTSLPKTHLSSPLFGGTSPVSGWGSPIFGKVSPVFGRTGTEKRSIPPATVDRESSSKDSSAASSPHGSAVYNKETRPPPPQCLQKVRTTQGPVDLTFCGAAN